MSEKDPNPSSETQEIDLSPEKRDDEPKEPGNLDNNAVSDWEGADEIEQDLQDKIKSNMEQGPKIESSIDLMAKQIADVSKNTLEQYARGEISDNDVKSKVMDQVEVAINTLVE